MKKYLLLCLLLGQLVNNHSAVAQTSGNTSISAKATPSQAYSQLASDVANLMQRVTTLPDDKALALLRRESSSLQVRAQYVKPAYQNWLKTLSAPELKVEDRRIASSDWGKYFLADFDSKLGAKVRRNQAIGEYIEKLMFLFDGV